MIKINFSEQDLKTIEYERFNHPIPLVRRRMEVLWLKSQGLPHKQIAKLAGVCDNALTKYLQLYRHGGLDEIRKVNFYRPKSELEKYSDSIDSFTKNILQCLAKTGGYYKKELSSFLSLNFQSFPNSQIVTGCGRLSLHCVYASAG